MSKRKPILASGLIVPDYEPLFKYWEIAKNTNRKIAENATLKNEDFEKIIKYISFRGSSVDLLELIEYFEEYMLNRVEGNIAVRALKEVYDIELEEEEAKRKIARILAGWLIEASDIWGILKLKGLRLSD